MLPGGVGGGWTQGAVFSGVRGALFALVPPASVSGRAHRLGATASCCLEPVYLGALCVHGSVHTARDLRRAPTWAAPCLMGGKKDAQLADSHRIPPPARAAGRGRSGCWRISGCCRRRGDGHGVCGSGSCPMLESQHGVPHRV